MSEWIEWKGGECPVSDNTRVDIKFRDETVFKDEIVGDWIWDHYQSGGDIVAYRVSGDRQSSSALETQIGGDHYKGFGKYQPWEVFTKWLTPEELRGFMKGTAIAYLARERDKGGNQDIEKAIHTLQGLLELEKK